MTLLRSKWVLITVSSKKYHETPNPRSTAPRAASQAFGNGMFSDVQGLAKLAGQEERIQGLSLRPVASDRVFYLLTVYQHRPQTVWAEIHGLNN